MWNYKLVLQIRRSGNLHGTGTIASRLLSHLEITKVVLVDCNIINNDYQLHLRVRYTLVPNKSFSQLLDILPKKLILKTFNEEFSYNEVSFTDQSSKTFEMEDEIILTLVINWSVTYKNDTMFNWIYIPYICEKI